MEPSETGVTLPSDDPPAGMGAAPASARRPRQPRKGQKPRERQPKPLQDASWVGNADAKQVALAAAKAVGLTLEQLSDLMVDTGLATIPKEKLTQKCTLQDLGMRLWASMQTVGTNVRVKWFNELAPVQQGSLLVTLRDRGFHFEVIAQEFAIPVQRVIDAWNQYCDELGAQVVGVRLQTIAGQLQSHASRAQQMAVEAGDHKSFWQISAEYVEMLQSLGIVDRAVHRVDHEITHKFEDQQRFEVEQMVALETKKLARQEELKLVACEVTDTLPQLTTDYDDSPQEKP
jgi:hypothetical protein